MKTIHKGNLRTSDLYIRSINKFLNNLLKKIVYYRKRPDLLSHDIKYFYYKCKYDYWRIVDPPPKQKRKERTDDYFDRIDPKYGLRFYGTMVKLGSNCNIPDAFQQINEMYKDKKTRDTMKEFVAKVVEIEQDNKEKYQRFLIKSEILKNQS